MLIPSAVLGFPSATPGGYIVSVQRAQISIAGGSTSGTATISSVSTTRTLVLNNGLKSPNTAALWSNDSVRVVLTNATTVTATRIGTTGALTVYVEIVEFGAGLVDSIQQGTVGLTTAQTTNTATISSVITARSAVYLQGAEVNDTSGASGQRISYVQLTNSTTVTATRVQSTASASTVGFAVIQFASGTIQSMQQTLLQSVNASQGDVSTISSVNAANCLLLWGGCNAANANWINSRSNGFIGTSTGATGVIFDREGNNANQYNVALTVVEFVSGIIKNVYNGIGGGFVSGNPINLTATTSASQTFAAVNTAKAFSALVGSTSGSNANAAQSLSGIYLANSTTVTGEKNTSTSSSYPGWEVVEFN